MNTNIILTMVSSDVIVCVSVVIWS